MARTILKAWLIARAERKTVVRNASGQYTLSVSDVLKDAARECAEYETIAGRSWWQASDRSVEELVNEMRSVVAGTYTELEQEHVLIVNDYDGSVISDAERAQLDANLNAMADRCEARIRDTAQSMFDRIGEPKGFRRPLTRKRLPLEAAIPGAHKAYR